MKGLSELSFSIPLYTGLLSPRLTGLTHSQLLNPQGVLATATYPLQHTLTLPSGVSFQPGLVHAIPAVRGSGAYLLPC